MLLYRIAKSQYADDLSGDGAGKAGGRWNKKGIPLLYTTDSTALATLESFVHTPLYLTPRNSSITRFSLPDELSVESILPSQLPKNRAAFPAPHELAMIGTEWVEKTVTVALRVTSALTPQGEGWNYLLNPNHPDFSKIRIVDITPYQFDNRLYSR